MHQRSLITVGRDAVVGVASLWPALWLFVDAHTFALRGADPVTGWARGCYTALDVWLGHLRPADWTREVERVGSLMLFALSAYCGWRLVRGWRRRLQPAAVQPGVVAVERR